MKALKNVRDIQVISELLKMQDFTKKYAVAFLITYSNVYHIFKKILDGDFFFPRFVLYIFHDYVVWGFFNRPNVTKK